MKDLEKIGMHIIVHNLVMSYFLGFPPIFKANKPYC